MFERDAGFDNFSHLYLRVEGCTWDGTVPQVFCPDHVCPADFFLVSERDSCPGMSAFVVPQPFSSGFESLAALRFDHDPEIRVPGRHCPARQPPISTRNSYHLR